MQWVPWIERAPTVKVELDRGSGILTRKTIDMKKSIREGRPCPDMMDHNEHSLLLWHIIHHTTLFLSLICARLALIETIETD